MDFKISFPGCDWERMKANVGHAIANFTANANHYQYYQGRGTVFLRVPMVSDDIDNDRQSAIAFVHHSTIVLCERT